MTDYTTTLNDIRAALPCRDGWEKLLAHLGKTKADDEPLPLLTVLDSNGLDDALWVLSKAMQPEHDRLSRHFQAWCAEQVLHLYEARYPGDSRVRDRIAMLRNDAATPDERAAAWAAAWDAARESADAADTAGSAEYAAEAAATRDATSAAWVAREAAWAAAWDADTAEAAAWAAQKQHIRTMLTEGF
jgi:hypothetical protein